VQLEFYGWSFRIFNKEFIKKVGLIKKNLRENQKDRTRSEAPSDKHGALCLCKQKQAAHSSQCREKYFLPSPKGVSSQSLKSGAFFYGKSTVLCQIP
jgi:hypothetical protein